MIDNKKFKIIISFFVILLFVVQFIASVLGSPVFVTQPPIEWGLHPGCVEFLESYYNKTIEESTIFGLVYVMIILTLLWFPKK